MMEVNIENYEAYLLDLWEGNLSEKLKVMLYKFLEENPEIDDCNHLDLLSDISIIDSNEDFDKSSINFEKINLKNYNFFFIAYSEGDLSKVEINLVDDFLTKNPKLNTEFAQFHKVKLPIETIPHPNKEKLILWKTPVIPIRSRSLIIITSAACIVLLLWIQIPFQTTDFKYTLSEYKQLEIEKYESLKIDFKSSYVVPKNKFSEQLISSIYNSKNIKNKGELHNQNFVNYEIENKIEDSYSIDQQREDLINVSNLEAKKFNSLTASIVSVIKSEKEKISQPINKSKGKPRTIIDLTTEYLQRKNVLTDKRKPNFKGVIYNTLTNTNENKKPIIVIDEKPNSKTTIFQLGGLRIERKSIK